MIISGYEFRKENHFQMYISLELLDANGEKMSKQLGNSPML